ncbi:L,D-transpeptidase [Methylobacterium nigriterrae]|uniref:L,D-transpeptidase n=1 Tax=Methylobacterium nigriterrae TaxID=3127512 RepID=UPI003013878A
MHRLVLPLLSSLAVLAAAAPPAWADVVISIDKGSQRMAVSVNGQQRYDWPVSTGASGYDTPSGAYAPNRMVRMHFSREWDDAPMPFAIFFTPNGHAIHGTNHMRQLGRPASHGCVRLAPRQAAALFALVQSEGLANTKVLVDGEGEAVADRGGSGPGVNPLAALQRSAAARLKWQSEPLGRAEPATAAQSAPIAPSPTVTASASPAATGTESAPQTAARPQEREDVLGRLLNQGMQAAKPICTRC